MKVTLVGTTILLRPVLEKTFIPIETTDLHTLSDEQLVTLHQVKPKNFEEKMEMNTTVECTGWNTSSNQVSLTWVSRSTPMLSQN